MTNQEITTIDTNEMLHNIEKPEWKEKLGKIALNKMRVYDLVRSFKAEIKGNEKLHNADSNQLLGGLISAARLGLTFGPPYYECYILPLKTGPTFYIGTKGLIKIAYQSGIIKSLNVQTVYEGDEFEYAIGTTPYIKHIPNLLEENDIKPFAYYATVKLSSGEELIQVLTEKVIKKKYYNPKKAPWEEHYEEMAKKVVLRKLMKLLPQIEDQRMIEVEKIEKKSHEESSQ